MTAGGSQVLRPAAGVRERDEATRPRGRAPGWCTSPGGRDGHQVRHALRGHDPHARRARRALRRPHDRQPEWTRAGSAIIAAGRRGDGPGRHRAGPGALTGTVGRRGRGRAALLPPPRRTGCAGSGTRPVTHGRRRWAWPDGLAHRPKGCPPGGVHASRGRILRRLARHPVAAAVLCCRPARRRRHGGGVVLTGPRTDQPRGRSRTRARRLPGRWPHRPGLSGLVGAPGRCTCPIPAHRRPHPPDQAGA